MLLRNRFISIFTLLAGIAIFSMAGFAQDPKPATTTTDKTDNDGTKTERPFRGEGRKFEGHRFGREGFGHGHRGGGMMRGLRGIELTDAQKTQIHSIMEANKPDHTNMEEFRTLAMAKHDGTITAEQQARLTVLKTEAREKGRAVHEQIMGILTPEQKQQIETRKQEMKQRMEERRKEWQQRKEKPAATTEKPNN
jgi:periplasmic protein CpxP/Spy